MPGGFSFLYTVVRIKPTGMYLSEGKLLIIIKEIPKNGHNHSSQSFEAL